MSLPKFLNAHFFHFTLRVGHRAGERGPQSSSRQDQTVINISKREYIATSCISRPIVRIWILSIFWIQSFLYGRVGLFCKRDFAQWTFSALDDVRLCGTGQLFSNKINQFDKVKKSSTAIIEV